MKLAQEAFDRAAQFIAGQARPLERALFAHYFEGDSTDGALAELAQFRNDDGGFGQGLEPDVRMPDSSAIATTLALQILRELSAGEDEPLVCGAIGYLLDTHDAVGSGWPIITPAVNDHPHAPWWDWTDDVAEGPSGYKANPTAEIVGYLWDWSGLVPAELRDRLTDAAVAHAELLPDEMEMHDMLCLLRLAETAALPQALEGRLMAKLQRAVDAVVVRDPAQWGGYCTKPLDVVRSPDSPFADVLGDAVGANLDYEIERQQDDGAWGTSWSWGEVYPDAWLQAEREWRGILALRMLRTLRAFGRLP